VRPRSRPLANVVGTEPATTPDLVLWSIYA
jgi:hypothetical protein